MDTTFPAGVSGNPAGSAYGSRQRTARLLDALAEGEAQELFLLIFDAAKAGDTGAMRIIADRIWPPRKGRPVRLDFPADQDPFASLGVVVKGMAEGVISPEEASAAATALVAQARLAETRREWPKAPVFQRVMILPDNGRGDAQFAARVTPVSEPPDTANVVDPVEGPQEAVDDVPGDPGIGPADTLNAASGQISWASVGDLRPPEE